MENLEKIIVDDTENIRIDQYLSEYYEDISRSKLSKMIKDNAVLVNGKSVKPSFIVSEDDLIEINLKYLELKELEAENLDIEVIYEDEDIAIINKPFGIISHPTNQIRTNTVVNFLLSKYSNLPSLYGHDRVGIVHRLDKDTSGLMIIALNENSMFKLKDIFKNRKIIKKYRAIVLGKMPETEGTIEGYISRSTRNRKLMMLSDSGKYSLTTYELKEYNEGFSYIELNLHTGRTHQIRVHLSSISHPILGDRDYNTSKSKFNVQRQLLQAFYLEFHHPVSGELMKFEIDPYPEFKKYYDLIFKGEEWKEESK